MYIYAYQQRVLKNVFLHWLSPLQESDAYLKTFNNALHQKVVLKAHLFIKNIPVSLQKLRL